MHRGKANGSDGDSARATLIDSLHKLQTLLPSCEREGAARLLMADLQRWLPRLIRRRFRAVFRELSKSDADAIVCDALQHVGFVAACRGPTFRGRTENAARAWCREIALNCVADELRVRSRQNNRRCASFTQVDDGPEAELERSSSRYDRETIENLVHAAEILRNVQRYVRETRRDRDVPSQLLSLWFNFSNMAGATLEEQSYWLGNGSAVKPERMYKIRQRGREVLREALAHLAAAPEATRSCPNRGGR